MNQNRVPSCMYVLLLASSLISVSGDVLAQGQKHETAAQRSLAGSFLVNPQFDSAHDFSEGLASVEIGGKWGFINERGKYVINPQFDYANDFSEGLATVRIGSGSDYKWGYVDKTGAVVIPAQFSFAMGFVSGYSEVCISGDDKKCGYINRKGGFVVNPRRVGSVSNLRFGEGLAAVDFADSGDSVDMDGNYGFIDTKGEVAIAPQFSFATVFSEGLAPVSVGGLLKGKYGFIDAHGKFAINPQFEFADAFSSGLALVRNSNHLMGFIKKDGTYAIPPSSMTPTRSARDSRQLAFTAIGGSSIRRVSSGRG